jgi:very-short-patch-repair endonuclease
MARAAGISDEALRRRDVVRLSRDTYVPRAIASDIGSRIEAVLMTAPADAVVSHGTAAALWQVEIPLSRDERVHVTVSTGSAVRTRADRVIHRSPLSQEETTSVRRLPVTTPARTWRDLAAVLERPALLAVTDQLLAAGCTREELARQLQRRPTGRGAARAREVLPLGDRRAESVMESWTRWLIHDARLPMPDLQVDVHSDGGQFVGRADFLWLDRKVIVEFDGDHHRERKAFVDDLRRQNGLVAAGWTILRFSSADVLGRPEYVIATIRRALR